MSSFRVVAFNTGHIDLLELRALELEDFGADLKSRAAMLSNMPHSYTLIRDGKVLCIMGFWELWEGVAEVFVLPSVHMVDYPLVVKLMRRILKNIKSTMGYHRMQSASVNDRVHSRFMRACGFKSEGLLKKYARSGRDYQMWGMTDD